MNNEYSRILTVPVKYHPLDESTESKIAIFRLLKQAEGRMEQMEQTEPTE